MLHYPGCRVYARRWEGRWVWNPGFKAIPGEIYLTEQERGWAAQNDADIIVEPNVKYQSPNKQWPVDRYQKVVDSLCAAGFNVAQFATGKHLLRGARVIDAPSFRAACAVLERAQLFIGPEGGLHHAAAAVNTDAVVIFGGFIGPLVTGYDSHINLFTGTDRGCGNNMPCAHCKICMDRITVEKVLESADKFLTGGMHIVGRKHQHINV